MALGISQYPTFNPSSSIIYIFQGEWTSNFICNYDDRFFFASVRTELLVHLQERDVSSPNNKGNPSPALAIR